ncbi:MAG: hypothetical protein WC505_06240 [Patescibacteria group bacterium]
MRKFYAPTVEIQPIGCQQCCSPDVLRGTDVQWIYKQKLVPLPCPGKSGPSKCNRMAHYRSPDGEFWSPYEWTEMSVSERVELDYCYCQSCGWLVTWPTTPNILGSQGYTRPEENSA